MLSRLIDALFWMGRYLERAENTARIVDVNYHAPRLQPDETSDDDVAKNPEPFSLNPWAPSDSHSMVHWLILDSDNPSSVPACLEKGHDNGQVARNKMDGETWECLNRAYLNYGAPDADLLDDDRLHEYCSGVRQIIHEFKGTIQSTMFRGEAWYYLMVGQFLERADNCLRQIEVLIQEDLSGVPEDAVRSKNRLFLESIGATLLLQNTDEDFLADPNSIRRFLLCSTESPRCLLFCLDAIQRNLRELQQRYYPDRDMSLDAINSFVDRLRTDQDDLQRKESFTDWVGELAEISEEISDGLKTTLTDRKNETNRSFQTQ